MATQIIFCSCSPLFGGKILIHFDDHIFQMGWFNHQPELLVGERPWAARPPQTPGHDRLVLWASFELHLVVRLPVFGGETSYRLTKKDGSLKFNRGVSITVPYCTYIGGIKQMQMYGKFRRFSLTSALFGLGI